MQTFPAYVQRAIHLIIVSFIPYTLLGQLQCDFIKLFEIAELLLVTLPPSTVATTDLKLWKK